MDVLQRFAERFGEPIEEDVKDFTDTFLAISARRDCGLIDIKICLSKHEEKMTEFKNQVLIFRPLKKDKKRHTVIKNERYIDLERLIELLDFFKASTFEVSFYNDLDSNNAVIVKINDKIGFVLAELNWLEWRIYEKEEIEKELNGEQFFETLHENYYKWEYVFNTVSISDDMEF